MREYKVTVDGEDVTVCLTEKQMTTLVTRRFNPHSSHWVTDGKYKKAKKGCSLCKQYNNTCWRCPLGHGESDGRRIFCIRMLDTISFWVADILRNQSFHLNKDGSVPKRIEAAFKKVRAFLRTSKYLARRPKVT